MESNQSIRRIQFSETGNASVLKTISETLKKPEPNEVVVKNEAIGINFIDIYFRTGLYPVDSLPSGLGSEGAGIVEAVGKNVTKFKPGDRVAYCSGPLGAYTNFHTVPESSLVALPESISFEQAAAMMLKGLTAAYLLLKTFPLKSKHTLLVHAAAGGVGTILTQWAQAIGANVIGTVGRKEKIQLAESQGCNSVLLYREIDVPNKVKELTNNKGVDVVYDSVGKDTFEASIDSLKPRGMMVSFGNASGAVPEFKPLLLAQKGSLFITRPTLGHYISDPNEQQELADALFSKVIDGSISIKIGESYPLNEVVAAHESLESGKTTGSIILTL
jgi:NADPH2:quinone reductase